MAERLGPNKYFAEVLPDRKSEKIGEPQGQGKYVAMMGDIWATDYSMVAIPPADGVLYLCGVAPPPTIGAVAMLPSTIVVAVKARPVFHGPAKRERDGEPRRPAG